MKLTTREAVLYVLSQRAGPSKYALAKALGHSPIMIDHYLNGSRMKQATADVFNNTFGIEISDLYDPTAEALQRHKNDTKEVPGGRER